MQHWWKHNKYHWQYVQQRRGHKLYGPKLQLGTKRWHDIWILRISRKRFSKEWVDYIWYRHRSATWTTWLSELSKCWKRWMWYWQKTHVHRYSAETLWEKYCKSHHKFNEHGKRPKTGHAMKCGETITLVTDAGTLPFSDIRIYADPCV